MTSATITDTTPRIYVACLAAYNNGILYGDWIDCDQDTDSIQKQIDELLENSPMRDAEEWAIHDFENWQDIDLSENEDIEDLAKLAEILQKHGKAYAVYVEYYGKEYATLEDFQDKYQGHYKSEEDFVEEHFRESNEIPDHLENYIDWKAMAHDWFISDYYSDYADGGYYVLRR